MLTPMLENQRKEVNRMLVRVPEFVKKTSWYGSIGHLNLIIREGKWKVLSSQRAKKKGFVKALLEKIDDKKGGA